MVMAAMMGVHVLVIVVLVIAIVVSGVHFARLAFLAWRFLTFAALLVVLAAFRVFGRALSLDIGVIKHVLVVLGSVITCNTPRAPSAMRAAAAMMLSMPSVATFIGLVLFARPVTAVAPHAPPAVSAAPAMMGVAVAPVAVPIPITCGATMHGGGSRGTIVSVISPLASRAVLAVMGTVVMVVVTVAVAAKEGARGGASSSAFLVTFAPCASLGVVVRVVVVMDSRNSVIGSLFAHCAIRSNALSVLRSVVMIVVVMPTVITHTALLVVVVLLLMVVVVVVINDAVTARVMANSGGAVMMLNMGGITPPGVAPAAVTGGDSAGVCGCGAKGAVLLVVAMVVMIPMNVVMIVIVSDSDKMRAGTSVCKHWGVWLRLRLLLW